MVAMANEAVIRLQSVMIKAFLCLVLEPQEFEAVDDDHWLWL